MASTALLAPTLALIIALGTCVRFVSAAPDGTGHVRTTDPGLRRLVQQGARASPIFRALMNRIEQSDVVVYLRCDGNLLSGSEGRLTFVSSAGGYRYVLARLRRRQSSDHQLAIIAHELQHAVEIANAPAIVDSPSLAREFQKIGFVNFYAPEPGIAFDSEAAIQTGNRVLRELSSGAD